MIKINLLPFRAARKQENIRRQVSVYFLTVLFLLTLMTYFHFSLGNELATLKSEETQLREKMKPYREVNRVIARMNQWKKEIKERLKLIETLETNRMASLRILVDVATSVPGHKLWLTSLSEKGGVLSLQGNAMDNDTVALFMTNLEKMDHITSVDLKETKLMEVVSYIEVTKDRFSKKSKRQESKEKEEEEQEKKKAEQVERKAVTYKVTHFNLACNTGYHVDGPKTASKKAQDNKGPSKGRR